MDFDRTLTCYLAGPISNCGDAQKFVWRKRLSKEILKRGWHSIDPTTRGAIWTPFVELREIDRSHVVIANLWRESIGTVVGIMQARRMGKPVILVDRNYINSRVLEEIVGKENIVADLDEVPAHLDRIRARFEQPLKVRKNDGTSDDFLVSKLVMSLTAACGRVKLNDDWLPTAIVRRIEAQLVLQEVHEITTKQIKQMVFAQLEDIARKEDGLYADSLKKEVGRVKQLWSEQEELKDWQEIVQSQDCQILTLKDKNACLKDQLSAAQIRLNCFAREKLGDLSASAPDFPCIRDGFKSVKEALKSAAEDLSPYVTVHERAVEGSEVADFKNPDAVYEVLHSLARYVRDRLEGEQEQAKGLKEWWQCNAAHQYAAKESETVAASKILMHQRTILEDGSALALEEHVKLGVGGADTCCRIYLKNRVTTHQDVLVGLVLHHPETLRTN